MHVRHERPLFLSETKPPFPPLSDLSLTSNQFVVYCSIGKGEVMRSVLSISLPERMALELNKMAKRTGRNKSDLVKESLAIYLWETRFQNARKRLGAKAKKAGIISEDDVFAEVS